ncbi:patatin-like phospholipase family protein [Gayadomonas joobiniege]|uniref:patatin-like phospholipase family protein n=1 Tax=Gayadomonas joobiniege TaxID=1234606 RepID=UPI000376CA75|nr:patatin-like phospholipase family protein [Gayadomonas joobiniege]
MTNAATTALLLLGGGARAAYQVGVLKAISLHQPHNKSLPFKILSGTSAGAMNAAALACYASSYPLAIKKLEWVWKNFTTDKVYTSNLKHFYRAVLLNLSQATNKMTYEQSISLLNNQPLIELLDKMLDLNRIKQHIEKGHLNGISITASAYSSGDSVSFFQSHNTIKNWHRAKRRGIQCQIKLQHLLASTAIPMLFPSVAIDDEYYADGSVHQYSPLSPAIRLGAQKILIIGMDQPPPQTMVQNQLAPTGGAILGHLLDSIFGEALTLDIERMHQVNQTLPLLISGAQASLGYRKIDALQIHPSQAFNDIAAHYYNKLPFSVRTLLRILGINKATAANSSLLSYLLFEAEFCRELIDIGIQDGIERRDELSEFLRGE